MRTFSLGVGGSVLSLFAVGCPEPGDLANPQDYTAAAGTATGGGATAGTGTGGSASPNTCETDCIKDIFQKQEALCKVCHGAMAAPAGLQYSGLNLASDGFTDRLKNVPAKHGDLPTGRADCTAGDKLIDTANPSASWLLKKIQGNQDNCGDRMPPASLTATQKTCMETYIACVAGGSITGGGGMSSGGTANGGAATGGTSAGTSSSGTGGKAGSGGTSGGTGGKAGSGGSGGAKAGNGGTGGA